MSDSINTGVRKKAGIGLGMFKHLSKIQKATEELESKESTVLNVPRSVEHSKKPVQSGFNQGASDHIKTSSIGVHNNKSSINEASSKPVQTQSNQGANNHEKTWSIGVQGDGAGAHNTASLLLDETIKPVQTGFKRGALKSLVSNLNTPQMQKTSSNRVHEVIETSNAPGSISDVPEKVNRAQIEGKKEVQFETETGSNRVRHYEIHENNLHKNRVQIGFKQGANRTSETGSIEVRNAQNLQENSVNTQSKYLADSYSKAKADHGVPRSEPHDSPLFADDFQKANSTLTKSESNNQPLTFESSLSTKGQDLVSSGLTQAEYSGEETSPTSLPLEVMDLTFTKAIVYNADAINQTFDQNSDFKETNQVESVVSPDNADDVPNSTKPIDKSPNQTFGASIKSSKPVQNQFNQGANEVPEGKTDHLNQFKKGSQTGAKPVQYPNRDVPSNLIPIESLYVQSGTQLRILQHFFELCGWTGSKVTPPITRRQLSERLAIPSETVNSSLKRLKSKQLIGIVDSKCGVGGSASYCLSDKTYLELRQVSMNEQSTKGVQIQFKQGSQTGANPSSKIDRNINNLTNYLEPVVAVKPTWFKDLNFTPVHPIGPMQVNSSIRDLIQEKLDAETVQQFLNKFKTWLAGQGRIQNPLAIFCSKIKELAIEGDSDVLSCMSDEERQIELQFAQELEKRRIELELIAKSREQKSKEQFEQKFEAWYLSTDRDEHESLLASTGFLPYDSEIYKTTLKEKYRLSTQVGE